MTTTPTITALAPWFGGKRTLAPRIVEQLGPHSAYWEPFCGSLSVLFAKPKATMETVNDLHGDLINLARVVQSDDLAPRLHDRMRRTLMHEGVMEDAAGRFTRARMVVSYYDHPLVRKLYDGWTFIPCPTTKAMVNEFKRTKNRGGNAERAPEVLIVNGAEIIREYGT